MRTTNEISAIQEELTMGLVLFDNSQNFSFQSFLLPSPAFSSFSHVVDYLPTFPENEGRWEDIFI